MYVRLRVTRRARCRRTRCLVQALLDTFTPRIELGPLAAIIGTQLGLNHSSIRTRTVQEAQLLPRDRAMRRVS